MIDKLVSVLRAAKLEPTAEELADALWLAAVARSMEKDTDATPWKTTSKMSNAASDDASSARSRRQKPQAPSSNTPVEAEVPAGELHQAMGHVSLPPTNKRGTAMASPAASALPGALELARALRPLKRRVPSRVHFEVDEEATAQRIAEQAADPVVVRPLRTRWLNLTLLVDEGPSMPIWQQTVRELHSLLGGHGAFGRIRRYGFIGESSGKPYLYARTGHEIRTVAAKELIDPAGRQLVLVVSDCVSRGWHDGRIAEMLNVWARRGPVGLLQVLPPRLWQRSALGAAIPVGLRVDHPGTANGQLLVEKNAWWSEDDSAAGEQIPIPVFGLERTSIEAWSNLIAGRTSNPVGGVILEGSGQGYASQSIDDEVAPDARSRVAYFRATSSLTAQKLATYFASAHYLSLPVMRLIQQTMVPEATLGHLAEVFLAGILREGMEKEDDPEYVRYYFVHGVRELLLNAAEEESIRKVLTAVSDYTTAHLGHKTSFRAILADSDGDGDEIIPEDEASFARIGADILRRLGGEYQQIANRIGTRLDVVSSREVYRYEPQVLATGIVGETRLIEYAREYEAIRNHSPSSMTRTMQLERLFDEIRAYLIAAQISTAIALDAFHRSGEGLRFVALAIVEANQDPAGFEVIRGAIAESFSKFEQYHALRIALRLRNRLSLPQKIALRNAIVHQRSGLPGTMIRPETDRWWLSEDLLRELDAPHQIVLILDLGPQSIAIEAIDKSLPTKYGRRDIFKLSEFGINPLFDARDDESKLIEKFAERVTAVISADDSPPHIYLVGRASVSVFMQLGRCLPRVEVTIFDVIQVDAEPYVHISPEEPAETLSVDHFRPKSLVEESKRDYVAVTISIDLPIPLEQVGSAFAAGPGLHGGVLKQVVEVRLDEQLESVGPTVRGTLAAMQLDEGFSKAATYGNRLALFIDGLPALAFLAGRSLDAYGFQDVVVTDLSARGARQSAPDSYALQVGARIHELRMELNMSVAELADASGLSGDLVSSVEHGLAVVTGQTIDRLAKGLRVPPLYLLTFASDDELSHAVELIRKLPLEDVKKLRRELMKAAHDTRRNRH